VEQPLGEVAAREFLGGLVERRGASMRRTVVLFLLASVMGCSVSRKEIVKDEIPQSYLQALANEEGITVDQARQQVMDARAKGAQQATGMARSNAPPMPPRRSPSGQPIYTR